MKIVQSDDVRQWLGDSISLDQLTRSIGAKQIDAEYLEQQLGVPTHLRYLIQRLAENDQPVAADALDSIPFYSLCRGLFIPLSLMEPRKALGWSATLIQPVTQ